MATRTLSRTLPGVPDIEFHPHAGYDPQTGCFVESDEPFDFEDHLRHGKWLIFYSDREGDMWSRACESYDRGELLGISSMKHQRCRSCPDKHVICLYTMETSENAIRSAGLNVMRRMHCHEPIFWKNNTGGQAVAQRSRYGIDRDGRVFHTGRATP